MNILLILIGKLIFEFSKTFNLGSGSTWPGHIALNIDESIVKKFVNNNPNLKIILIAGTNGKTTTVKLIKYLLEKNGKKVLHNKEGANLLNGITSTLIKHSNIFGEINYDAAIFEVDENTLPLLLKELTPNSILILNLFRDQLDRYGEVNTIASKWKKALSKLSSKTSVYLNGDDPLVSSLGQNLNSNTFYFGIDKSLMERKEIPHDVDSIYCPNCSYKLIFAAISYSHLGDYKCTNCGFKRGNIESYKSQNLNYPLLGKYNIYNTNAAILFTTNSFNIPISKIKDYLIGFKPAFGRQEIINYKNKKIMVFLSKNPTGFNQSIETVVENNGKNILVVLNDRIPDGRDVSWIWDVDFEKIAEPSRKIYVSGDRVYDLALRLKYGVANNQKSQSQTENIKIYENLEESIETAVKSTEENETLYILPTYSAMLEVREILKGRKIL